MNETVDPWMRDLQERFKAGYYKTESAETQQTAIPWANATCEGCPFFSPDTLSRRGMCDVWNRRIYRDEATCAYYDEPNREAARNIIQARAHMSPEEWSAWLAHNRIPLD